MVILVTGGSGSGKSAFAEEKVMELSEDHRVYLATMERRDEESEKRIYRHQQMRKEKKFHTVECPCGLERLSFQKEDTVLLECVSNLMANELYGVDGRKSNVTECVTEDISSIAKQVKHLILVTNDVFKEGLCYDESTNEYCRMLGRINEKLAALSDEVYEVVYGIPFQIK